jgi:hypothetical protein
LHCQVWSIADYFGREREALLAAFERAEVSAAPAVGSAEVEAEAIGRLSRTESAFSGGVRPMKQRCVVATQELRL